VAVALVVAAQARTANAVPRSGPRFGDRDRLAPIQIRGAAAFPLLRNGSGSEGCQTLTAGPHRSLVKSSPVASSRSHHRAEGDDACGSAKHCHDALLEHPLCSNESFTFGFDLTEVATSEPVTLSRVPLICQSVSDP
jgi:hypothetical protein